MVVLTCVHIVYLLLIVLFLALMLFKKSIVAPCAGGILVISLFITHSLVGSFQALFNTLVWAGTELFGIITVIAIVVAMTSALRDLGADQLIIRPLHRVVRGQSMAFFILGIVMFLVSLCIWPSPAVALVGALLLPIAISTGVPVIWAAVAMNLFGHGMALSGDFFIQGAPTITAKAAGTSVSALISGYLPLWGVMSITVITASFILFKKDIRHMNLTRTLQENAENQIPIHGKAVAMAILTPAAFVADVIVMLIRNLQGGDATALIGGTAFILLVLADLFKSGTKLMLDKVSDHIKEGFSFGIQIFAPVIVIGGFFFLGGQGAAQAVFGSEATGLLSDIGTYLAQNVPLSKFPVVLVQAAVSVITGLDGSGFSGLPLIGATAATFSNALPIHKEVLAGMGQLITIWIGGGTVIPWAVIPVAAICNVSPEELVRKNLIPVLCGIAAVIIATLILI
ncbi:hypothetical protein OBV_06070 [Oscillibacter valericigenes Sjm18-20]|nr:hypothetical protein OBV_06070 [Oscillibacter valericigenes Sjm18-20]